MLLETFYGCQANSLCTLGAYKRISNALTLLNGAHDFLQTRYINFFLDAYSNILVIHYRKVCGNPNLVAQFQTSEVRVTKKRQLKPVDCYTFVNLFVFIINNIIQVNKVE